MSAYNVCSIHCYNVFMVRVDVGSQPKQLSSLGACRVIKSVKTKFRFEIKIVIALSDSMGCHRKRV